MRYCSVVNCTTNGSHVDMRIHTVREEWKSLSCWKNIPTFICSRHFTKNSYSKSKKKFKKSAKPTVFLPTQILAEHNYAFPDNKVLKRR